MMLFFYLLNISLQEYKKYLINKSRGDELPYFYLQTAIFVQVAVEWFQIKAENVSIQVYVSIFQRRAGATQR